jgi:hypothetical protein
MIWILKYSHGAFDHCPCLEEISCLPIWWLKSRKRWWGSTLVNKLLFTKTWHQIIWLLYHFLCRISSQDNDLIRIWNLYAESLETICSSESLKVQQALYSAKERNWAPWLSRVSVCSCFTTASPILPWYEYFLIKKSLETFEIFQGQFQVTL